MGRARLATAMGVTHADHTHAYDRYINLIASSAVVHGHREVTGTIIHGAISKASPENARRTDPAMLT